MTESARLCIDRVMESPHDRSIAYDEVASARCIENDPSQSREESNLKVPSLQVYQLQEIVARQKKPPSLVPEALDVCRRNIISDSEHRVFHTVEPGVRSHLLKTGWWRLNKRGIIRNPLEQ